MNIKECTAYRVGEIVFPTIQEAQKSELEALFDGLDDGASHERAKACAAIVVSRTDEVIAILTCTPNSRPRKPRSDIGKKRAKKDSTPAAV